MKQRPGNISYLLPSGCSVNGCGFVQFFRNVVQSGYQNDEVESYILPDNRSHHNRQRIQLLPVGLLSNHLTEHSSVILEDQVEQNTKCSCRNDDWEKVYDTEKLGSSFYVIYQHCQDNGQSYLTEQGNKDHDHGIFQCHSHVWISEQFRIVFIKWIVDPFDSSAQIPDLHKAVYNVLKERIVEKYCHEKKRRNQKHPCRFFILIYVHSNTPFL